MLWFVIGAIGAILNYIASIYETYKDPVPRKWGLITMKDALLSILYVVFGLFSLLLGVTRLLLVVPDKVIHDFNNKHNKDER